MKEITKHPPITTHPTYLTKITLGFTCDDPRTYRSHNMSVISVKVKMAERV